MKQVRDKDDIQPTVAQEGMPMLLCSRILYKYENIDLINGSIEFSCKQVYAKIKAIDMNRMGWEDKHLTEEWLNKYKKLFG